MRIFCTAMVLLWALGCGDDDDGGTTAFDAPLVLVDGGGGADAPPVVRDAAAEPDAPSSIGKLCATTAVDGGPGSCAGGVCCNVGGSTICTLPSDCPTGPGYKSCTASSQCQGSICCALPAMTFCTKNNVCAAYGGTVLP